MRIALVTDGIYPYVLGGMQKHSYYLCKYLAQNKIQVELFHYNDSTFDIDKLEYFSEEEKAFITNNVLEFPHSLRFPGHYLYNSYRYSKNIYEKIKSRLPEFDFIYTKGFAGWYLINEKFSGKIICGPIGVKFHGYEMFQQQPELKTKIKSFILKGPVKKLSLRADVVFSYGGKITSLIKSLGVLENKIFEMPAGIESSVVAKKINPVQGTIKILFLGRYERRKGIEELNICIRNLVGTLENQNMEFHFVGPIPQKKKISFIHVFYHGEIRTKDELLSKIDTCDILICPSWSEGMPNVILEAMARGLAVIATDRGATSALVNPQTGWLIDRPDVNEITRILKSIASLSNEQINQKKLEALTLIKKNFTWEKLIEKLIGLWLK